MAIFQCNYRSKVQGRSVFFNVILPEQCEKDVPAIYMLHGTNSNCFDWIKALSLERYATARSIAVVMPTCDNSYYTDMKYGFPHYTHIIEELIPYTRKMFGLSDKREKTFVSGFSMGGYGAVKLALRNPDMFAAAAPMSGVFNLPEWWKTKGDDDTIPFTVWGPDYKDVFPGSDDDLFKLVKDFETNGKPKPWIYQCCGTEDSLIGDNRKFRDFIKDKGFRYEYEEWPGAHTWDYWDEAIPKCIDFCKKYMKENGVEEYLNGRFPSSVERVTY